jgi:hypothetical protein
MYHKYLFYVYWIWRFRLFLFDSSHFLFHFICLFCNCLRNLWHVNYTKCRRTLLLFVHKLLPKQLISLCNYHGSIQLMCFRSISMFYTFFLLWTCYFKHLIWSGLILTNVMLSGSYLSRSWSLNLKANGNVPPLTDIGYDQSITVLFYQNTIDFFYI